MEKTMERTKEGNLLTWRKTGGGSFRLGNGKIIKPNQVFTASLDQVPESCRDVVVLVKGNLEEEVKKDNLLDVYKTEYTIESRGYGYYNVVDGEGKVMNEKALRETAAEELVITLNT